MWFNSTTAYLTVGYNDYITFACNGLHTDNVTYIVIDFTVIERKDMLLVILQNAYRETGEYKDRDEWVGRMWRSHTGRRLREMLPDVEVHVENANPKLGRGPNSIFPPDISHLKSVIKVTKPKIILACGKVAQEGLEELGVDYIPAPHPAWRQLSKKDTSRIRKKLASIV